MSELYVERSPQTASTKQFSPDKSEKRTKKSSTITSLPWYSIFLPCCFTTGYNDNFCKETPVKQRLKSQLKSSQLSRREENESFHNRVELLNHSENISFYEQNQKKFNVLQGNIPLVTFINKVKCNNYLTQLGEDELVLYEISNEPNKTLLSSIKQSPNNVLQINVVDQFFNRSFSKSLLYNDIPNYARRNLPNLPEINPIKQQYEVIVMNKGGSLILDKFDKIIIDHYHMKKWQQVIDITNGQLLPRERIIMQSIFQNHLQVLEKCTFLFPSFIEIPAILKLCQICQSERLTQGEYRLDQIIPTLTGIFDEKNQLQYHLLQYQFKGDIRDLINDVLQKELISKEDNLQNINAITFLKGIAQIINLRDQSAREQIIKDCLNQQNQNFNYEQLTPLKSCTNESFSQISFPNTSPLREQIYLPSDDQMDSFKMINFGDTGLRQPSSITAARRLFQ